MKKTKIVLFALNASFSHSNLAIRRIREHLDESIYEISLLEGGLRDTDDSILESLFNEKADVYGFSCYIWNIERTVRLCENLKGLLPHAVTVFGGPEVSYDVERFTELDFVDCTVSGGGEDAFTRICADVRDGKSVPKHIYVGKTPLYSGILYRTDEALPKTLYYESSVGCPFSCAFCLSSAEKGVIAKSAEQTLSELLEFEKLDGDFIIKFIDRSFNFDAERANEIWKGLLDPKYTKRYQFEVCASLLNEESFKVLSDFPRDKVQLEAGLQSTNEKTLAAVARHQNVLSTLNACRRIKNAGNVHVHLDLIAGLPYEDYTSFKKSYNDAYENCHCLQLGFLKLLFGTALRRDADKYGYKYLAQAPYTVLCNDFISYSELRYLDVIADLTDRYYNSGHFERTLAYAVPYADSPFDFYEGLADFIKENDGRSIRKIGQNDAYGLLFTYASAFDGIDCDVLERELHSDYAKFEVRRPPRLVRSSKDES